MMGKSTAELVDHLFKTCLKENGREYSYREVSRAMDGQVSPAALAKLRSGEIENPGRQVLLLLCKFFKVPASYFFPELDDLAAVSTDEERIEIALRATSLPRDVQQHIQWLIKAIQRPVEDRE